ncbi:MAG TPA: rhamnogalacturonan acetylesterase, partial [Pyrinomonadaceae bacterium]
VIKGCFAVAFIVALTHIASAQPPIAIYLAGDSTMAEKLAEKRPERGWGEKLQQFFDPAKVKIDNRAKNGRSTRTFLSEGLWTGILQSLKPGDYVFIQFGHNDESKEKTDRYTAPADYQANLVRFVNDVRERKANPILFTPVVRRRFNAQGDFYDTHGEYPDLVRAVASAHKVPLIDMQQKSESALRRYGAEESRKLFLQLKPGENPNYPNGIEDNTHFNPVGAEAMAQLAVEGIKELKIELTRYLKP